MTPAAPAAARATILVVDDTPDNLALMSSLLKDDYRVRIANSGARALEIAASSSPPSLILLDIMMPEMDGYEVCERLQRAPATAGIPVIFLTAKAEVEDERRGLALGAVDYITKPISPPILLARVKSHLALRALSLFLLERNVELERARAAADAANLAKSSFLSGMSHELRSPLNAILGFAQLMELERPPPTAAQAESLAQILKAGWHLLTLINEVLDLAKVESGQVPLVLESVSVAELLEECRCMIEAQAQQRGITLRFPAPEGLPFLRADRTRCKQILLNLLSNAVKYNSPGGYIDLTVELAAGGRVRVGIRDTGRGLSIEQLSRLFQAFHRLGQESGAQEGTGIGLVVAKRLVELMGGTIGVESHVGAGCLFWFELEAATAPSVAPAVAEPAPIDVESTRPRTLLYVEDDPANVLLVTRLLAGQRGLRLLTAIDGPSGVALAREARPEVILLDVHLPGFDGFEVLRRLRADPATADCCVVAVSAQAMVEDVARGLEGGFFRYLTKPLDVQLLLQTLRAAFAVAHQDRARSHQNDGLGAGAAVEAPRAAAPGGTDGDLQRLRA